VRFGSTQATEYSSWSNTRINVTVPPRISKSAKVGVTTGGGTSNALTFNVDTPALTSISPITTSIGFAVAITGTNFGSIRGSSTVTFGTKAASTYASWTDTEIQATVPTGISKTVDVTVSTDGGTSNSTSRNIEPKISSLSPTSTTVGSSVTINGSGFGSLRGSATVKFGSTKVSTYSSWANTKIVVKVPSGVSRGQSVTVTTSGGTYASKTFNVKPKISSLSPTSERWPPT
jgi:hypothetical protein